MNEQEIAWHIRYYEKRLNHCDRKLRKAGEKNQSQKIQAVREQMAHDRAAIRAFRTVQALAAPDGWEG